MLLLVLWFGLTIGMVLNLKCNHFNFDFHSKRLQELKDHVKLSISHIKTKTIMCSLKKKKAVLAMAIPFFIFVFYYFFLHFKEVS